MTIREMTLADLEFASFCTAEEGWGSETKAVFEDFHAFYPEGCLVSEKNGIPTGIAVSTRYFRHGFIGELIVLPEFRGRGTGSSLFRRSLDLLRERGIRSVLLDAALKAVPIYEREGFVKKCRSLRFAGSFERYRDQDKTVERASHQDIELIKKADLDLFGDDRSFFLGRIWDSNHGHCLVQKEKGEIKGYIFGRMCGDLMAVGPWAVFEGGDPMPMLGSLSSISGGVPLRIGVLESNVAAVDLLRGLKGFKEEEHSWRMEWGVPSVLGSHRFLFGIGSAARG